MPILTPHWQHPGFKLGPRWHSNKQSLIEKQTMKLIETGPTKNRTVLCKVAQLWLGGPFRNSILLRCPLPGSQLFIGDDNIVQLCSDAPRQAPSLLLATTGSSGQMSIAQFISQLSSRLTPLSWRRRKPPGLLRCPLFSSCLSSALNYSTFLGDDGIHQFCSDAQIADCT